MLTPEIFTVGQHVELWLKSNYHSVFKNAYGDHSEYFIDKYNENPFLFRLCGSLDEGNKTKLITEIVQKLNKFTQDEIVNSITITRYVWWNLGVARLYDIIGASEECPQSRNDVFDFPAVMSVMSEEQQQLIIDAYSNR